MLAHLTKDNFKEFYTENKLCLVDFWAQWCGPCRMLTPVLEELHQKTNLPIGKVNVDEEEELAEALRIQSIPALFLFKDGKLVDKKVGYLPMDALASWVKSYE
ncbi:MAG: thioredoxin [Erysipelotrichaceae bacterium]|nr:thioredoxin [Erysipelotrichaceae bacterium]